jgi:hypothetical protein
MVCGEDQFVSLVALNCPVIDDPGVGGRLMKWMSIVPTVNTHDPYHRVYNVLKKF